MQTNSQVEQAGWIGDALRRYQQRLTHYACRLTGNLEQARDAVQDTFLELCREERERVEGHLAQWLFTVCRNRALDLRRKENRMTPLKEAAIPIAEGIQNSPELRAEHREAASRILEIVQELPAHQQEVVRLRFQQELSYREIAAVTQLSVSNVGFLLHTALKTVRSRMRARSGSASRKLRRIQ